MSPPDRPANFDRLAGVYDRLANIVFGDTLHIAQTRGLEHLPSDSNIAIIGGGSGRILESLFATGKRFESVAFVDTSEKMVARAAARLRSMQGRPSEEVVEFFAQPAESWCSERPDSFDAVITPFFLDCFDGNELKRMIAQIAALLRKGGQWLVTDFVSSPKLSHRLMMATMFRFFRLSCGLRSRKLEPYFELIETLGFESKERHDFKTIAGAVRCQHFERSTHFSVDSITASR